MSKPRRRPARVRPYVVLAEYRAALAHAQELAARLGVLARTATGGVR